jgi:excisionase family DNA binding protein
MQEKLLKVDEVAERLNAHPTSVRNWLATGKLRGLKLAGRSWRIPESALREFLDRAAASAQAEVTG